MLSRILPGFLVGSIALSLHTINTFFWFAPIIIVALLKGIFRVGFITKMTTWLLNWFASSWISVNQFIHAITKPIDWQVSLPADLKINDWYLVIANHRSWVDILALQQVFNGKIPFLKFFLKQQLIWVPVLGIAWWALDFPFMRRYSKSYIKKHPEQKGKDFATTQKACLKFKTIPISIMNFLEGTRFTKQKHDAQNSPFQHLLKPKAGGVGYVLTLMGDEIKEVIDVTISYPKNTDFSFWDFLCGRVKQINLQARKFEIPAELRGDYINDPQVRKKVQQWLNQLWQYKDQQLAQILDVNN